MLPLSLVKWRKKVDLRAFKKNLYLFIYVILTRRSIYFCSIGQYRHPAIPTRLSSLIWMSPFSPIAKNTSVIPDLRISFFLPGRKAAWVLKPDLPGGPSWLWPHHHQILIQHLITSSLDTHPALPHPASWPWPWNPSEDKSRRKEGGDSDREITHCVHETMLF